MNTIKNMRACENCIWYDQCGDRGVCDDYDSELVEEVIAKAEYFDDLRTREDEYSEQVAEQNS